MSHKPYNKLINKILLMLNNVETVKQTLFNISYLIWLLKFDCKMANKGLMIMLFICIRRINLNLSYLF